MAYDFDLLVIGAGSGGVRASRMVAQTGAKVAIVEARYLGGTCVNVGCVPKKLFYYSSHYASDFSDAHGYGWTLQPPQFDWPTLRDNKTREIERLNGIYRTLLDQAGVNLIEGFARFVDPHTVEVEGKRYSAEKILVAVGGAPSVPDIPGREFAITSDDVFYLDKLPEKALVVGGGYIAVEFAGILHGLGVHITLSYRGPQLLRHFDHDLGKTLLAEMQKQGIEMMLESDVESLQQAGEAIEVHFKAHGKQQYDAVLYATGRSPGTRNIGLEHTSVNLRANGEVIVDEYFQSAEPSIFALGDIIGTPELTPVAIEQGMAFADTWFKNQRRKVDYNAIPTAVFSHPNIGTVGLSEQQARREFSNIDVYESEFRHLKHTLSGNSERTYMKLVVDKDSDKVLGIHMVGADAGEIIQGLAVAIKAGVTKTVLDSTIGIHPTAAEEFVTMRIAN